jgi:hypothetical protein
MFALLVGRGAVGWREVGRPLLGGRLLWRTVGGVFLLPPRRTGALGEALHFEVLGSGQKITEDNRAEQYLKEKKNITVLANRNTLTVGYFRILSVF